MLLSVGSYRLCENSLKMTYFPLEVGVARWSYQCGTSGLRIINLLFLTGSILSGVILVDILNGEMDRWSWRGEAVRGRGWADPAVQRGQTGRDLQG